MTYNQIISRIGDAYAILETEYSDAIFDLSLPDLREELERAEREVEEKIRKEREQDN